MRRLRDSFVYLQIGHYRKGDHFDLKILPGALPLRLPKKD